MPQKSDLYCRIDLEISTNRCKTIIWHLKVNRKKGARGVVELPYTIISGTAEPVVDFDAPLFGQMIFQDEEFQ